MHISGFLNFKQLHKHFQLHVHVYKYKIVLFIHTAALTFCKELHVSLNLKII